eukprot:607466-Pyramimonas_sp.AAC.1
MFLLLRISARPTPLLLVRVRTLHTTTQGGPPPAPPPAPPSTATACARGAGIRTLGFGDSASQPPIISKDEDHIAFSSIYAVTIQETASLRVTKSSYINLINHRIIQKPCRPPITQKLPQSRLFIRYATSLHSATPITLLNVSSARPLAPFVRSTRPRLVLELVAVRHSLRARHPDRDGPP